MRTETAFVTLAVCLTIVAAGTIVARGGPLDPPGGPVAPTYKTLAEVEPRTVINSQNTPGDADSLYKITKPGSYYLDRHVTGVSGKRGIEIASDSVTVDFMGFDLAGVVGSLEGIYAASSNELIVRNGSVHHWGGDGVRLGSGQSGSSIVENVHARSNQGHGFSVGSATLRSCKATINGGDGFRIDGQSTATDCVAHQNISSGFNAAGVSVLRGCVAHNNSVGINAVGSSVIDCNASRNINGALATGAGVLISRCAFNENQSNGIVATDYVTIENSSAAFNGAHGIVVGNACVVRDNLSSRNGQTGTGAGIRATGNDHRIEGNTLEGNDMGLDLDGCDSIVIRNSARANGANYANVAGCNHLGTVVGSESAMNNAVNANVNWSF